MRAVSLPRFLQSQLVAKAAAFALLLSVALLALLVLGVAGAAAAELSPGLNVADPFRW
jgi:hypothetical protein